MLKDQKTIGEVMFYSFTPLIGIQNGTLLYKWAYNAPYGKISAFAEAEGLWLVGSG